VGQQNDSNSTHVHMPDRAREFMKQWFKNQRALQATYKDRIRTGTSGSDRTTKGEQQCSK